MMHRLLRVIAFAGGGFALPAMALAADEEKPPDARIQNFTKTGDRAGGGTALTWLLADPVDGGLSGGAV
jgi:hypothetical protein